MSELPACVFEVGSNEGGGAAETERVSRTADAAPASAGTAGAEALVESCAAVGAGGGGGASVRGCGPVIIGPSGTITLEGLSCGFEGAAAAVCASP